MRRHNKLFTGLLGWFLVGTWTLSCDAQDSEVERRLEHQLAQPASIYWSEVPLRKAVEELAATRDIAIWLDRRCDPNQTVTFQANLPTLADCFREFSRQHDRLDVAWLPGIVVVGPEDAPNRIATVAHVHQQLLKKLPSPARQRWQQHAAMDWPRLTTPQELLLELEQEVGLPTLHKQRVEHDLWPAVQLPPLPAYRRLGLLLGGFELTFVFAADGAAKIVDLPANPRYVATVPRAALPRVRKMIAADSTAELNDRKRPPRLLAGWQVHQEVKALLRPKPIQPSQQLIRYSLRVDNQPAGDFIRGLGMQLNLDVEFAAAAEPHLQQRISFQVTQVDMATLIRTTMQSAKFAYDLSGQTLRVLGPRP